MFARLASYGAPGVTKEQAVGFFQERVLPDLSGMDGFCEALLLVSDDSDEALAISLWDSEASMLAAQSTTAAHRRARDEMGGKRTAVKVYEVAHRSGPLQR